jgi:hypothetical protein
MTICAYCNANPPIENSHVVPRFIVKLLKANSPEKFIFDTWKYKKMQDGLKGPYLCEECDNVLFSAWENDFKKAVFDPVHDGKPGRWAEENSIRFLLAVAFRYMVHFDETSPISANRQRNLHFRDLLRQTLDDLTQLDSKLFVYPYQYRPIVSGCGFLPGINHFLQLGFQCHSLAGEENLPQALLLYLPGMMTLFTDGDMRAAHHPEFPNPISLTVGTIADFGNANLTMPQFLRPLLNEAVGHTTGHQKAMEMWDTIEFQQDKMANPDKQLYRAQALDRQLFDWQKENCP